MTRRGSEKQHGYMSVTTRRTYKDKVYETHLLRRSYRQDDTVDEPLRQPLSPPAISST